MELIERYIYAVVKDLPESERAEVESELRANIEDMLSENYDENNIKNVLENLGDPEKLADEYRGVNRYLIGPKYYSAYVKILKLVIYIATAVIGSVSVISVLLKQPAAGQIVDYITEAFVIVFQAVISAATGAAVWVTIIFAVIEKSGAKMKRGVKTWTIEKLPQKPAQTAKISRGGIIISLIFYVLWIGILVTSPDIIGIYQTGYGMTPLFNNAVLQHYMPLILLLSGFGIFTGIVKFIYGRWNGKIAVLNLIMNIMNMFTVVILLRNNLLFNPAFFERFSAILHLQLSVVNSGKTIFIWFIIVMTFIGSVTDSVSGFAKTYKTGK